MPLVQCNECGKEISSLATACPECGAPIRPMPDFYVMLKGKRYGPYTEVAVGNYLAAGRIRPNDLCWRPGMGTWVPVEQVPQLQHAMLVSNPRVGNQSNVVAGFLGFFLGPVGLWYKGHWAAGFAWITMIVIVALGTGGFGIVFAPVFWIGMTIHAIVAEPRV